jgi:hypothetical protein
VFSISDASGNPITDLEPLMGAGGHSVIISSDKQEFLHVHPTEEVNQIEKVDHISLLEPAFQNQDYTRYGDNSSIKVE